MHALVDGMVDNKFDIAVFGSGDKDILLPSKEKEDYNSKESKPSHSIQK